MKTRTSSKISDETIHPISVLDPKIYDNNIFCKKMYVKNVC